MFLSAGARRKLRMQGLALCGAPGFRVTVRGEGRGRQPEEAAPNAKALFQTSFVVAARACFATRYSMQRKSGNGASSPQCDAPRARSVKIDCFGEGFRCHRAGKNFARERADRAATTTAATTLQSSAMN